MDQIPHTQPPTALHNDILEVIADAGAALIANGAEVSRAEDTMERLARAFGLYPVEAIVLPTALFLYSNKLERTIIRRIRRRSGFNLSIISAINQLSRDIARAPVPPAQFAARLNRASHHLYYPGWATVLFGGMSAGLISQLMHGVPVDILPAFFAGIFAQGVRQFLLSRGLPVSLTDLFAAFFAVLPALASAVMKIPDAGPVFVSGVMVLVPGLLITTAIRDGIAGDLISAVGRIFEALLIAGAVAAGATLPLYIYLGLGGHWP